MILTIVKIGKIRCSIIYMIILMVSIVSNMVQVFVPAALALVICELAPLMLDVSTDTGEIAIAGLLMAQGTLMWVMLRKEQAQQALLLKRIRFMLQDRIRNKLQVLAGSMQGSAEVFQAIEDVADAIDELSDVALKRWEDRLRLANGR